MTPAPLPSLAAFSTSPAAARARVAPAEPVQALQAARALGSGAGSAFSDDPFARLLESRREAARLEERRQQDRAAEQPRHPPTALRSPARADAPAPTAPADGSNRTAADSANPRGRPLPDNGSSGVQRRWLDTRAGPGRAAGAPAGSTARPAAPDAASEHLAAEGDASAKATRASASDLAEPPPNGPPPGADPRAPKAGLMPVECPCPPSEALAVPGIPSAEAAAASPAETARRQTAAQADLPAAGRAQAAALGTTSGGVAAADAAAVASAEKAGLAAAEAPAQGTRAAASPATAHAAADALGQAPAWSAATGPAGQEAQTPGAHPAAAAASADLAAAPGSDASALPAPAGTPGLSTGEARTAATAAPAAAAQAQLPAAPGHPAFPAQLASQLSIWVRAGVQQAQLHLNPAELGPVQVAIALEGSAAQVRLVAEHATTRQALEQALPALAGRLAEAGLMLAGGGVFDQSGPREGPATPGHQALRSRAPGSAAAADLPATGTTLPRPRGLVDLLA